MSDKAQLLRQADETFGALREAVRGLDEGRWRETWFGTWGAREILVHIAAWDRAMAPALHRLGQGQAPYPAGVSYDDADGWNARFVEAKRDAKTSEVLAELDAAHHDIVAAATALDPSHFAAGAQARELFEGTTCQHYREHADQIREWRRAGPA
ncbi:MAG: ClbS/DfsB family four-helix bundle protein [Candidatus Rokubacteria bacterium]|nr:ClbS/DfsB family four-helix bundle protein [Candidatus Rokubacteria bacterium]